MGACGRVIMQCEHNDNFTMAICNVCRLYLSLVPYVPVVSLGVFTLCTYDGTYGDDCAYDQKGSLRDDARCVRRTVSRL